MKVTHLICGVIHNLKRRTKVTQHFIFTHNILDFAFDCSFEVGNCYWSTFPETSYVWKITETPITTGANGPYTDHTTGAGKRLHYHRSCLICIIPDRIYQVYFLSPKS